MENRVVLGKSGLIVNPVGLGANAVGGHNLYPNLDEEVGKDLVRKAIENGMNFIDTAFSYGPARSEELIAEVLKESGKRHEVIVATKIAQKFVDGKKLIDNSPAFLRSEVEKSLKRLQTDYIDLLYLHYPDESTPKDEAIGALKQLKDEGKIRAIGVSNFTPQQLKEANKDGYVDAVQGEYNLLSRSAETDYFPYTIENNIAFIPYFPLASGLLTGKYTAASTFNDLRNRLPYFQEEVFAKNLEKVERVRSIANQKGVDVAHIVLAWYLEQEAVTAVIPGAKNSEQVLNNLKTLDVQLTNDEILAIDLLFKA
ncbi:aldo/keto reductase [Ureibacillus sinduriensis]|uniref:Oxidoreductase n=1 Tax=Ureibacillus sinduriensis BLB-1 = JCM 15800 TaxID=1384057 RepID=A0A0A3HXY5_9BACL|nr:aldo/keto reductase [Ureibacillus sinduriensis]KGR76100.1 oxidoreductase [Ureibacillus sinduriensis BLB-1 = JCM 15800]